MLISLATTTRAVDSRPFFTVNEQSAKETYFLPTLCMEKNLGKARTCGRGRFLSSQPYMNTLYLRLCPCKSMYILTSRSLRCPSINSFRLCTVGCTPLMGVFHCLFRSTPARLHLLLPYITPSGLSIGTTNITNACLSNCAWLVPEVRKSSIPFIIQLAGVSPGCTLALTNKAGFNCGRAPLRDFEDSGLSVVCTLIGPMRSFSLSAKFVITSTSQSSPDRV
mmetsp:Transcript_6258/g.13822  ORF Transcript_6258/g.13822 Transcript_6258/m.13822 type:complete len:222 (-) Transcript_6258:2943-3608(-)